MDDRRSSCRVSPAQEICVSIGGNRSARLVDITPSGAHLELSTALNPNHTCRISLELGDETVRIKARVAHCKLTGFTSFGSGGQLVYRAGIEFVEIDENLADAIRRAYPLAIAKPTRTGPIKVKVNVDALERAAAEEQGTN